MFSHNDLISTVRQSWDDLWGLLKTRPHLLLRRETQVHIELAHLLMGRLSESPVKRWHDYEIYFDTPNSLAHSGLIEWDLVGELRPDILLTILNESLAGSDKRGLAIEIKILRSLADNVDEEFGTVEVCNIAQQKANWCKDVRKLKSIASSFGATKLQGVMLTMNYHHDARGAIEKVFPMIRLWDDSESPLPGISIRRKLELIDGTAPSFPF